MNRLPTFPSTKQTMLKMLSESLDELADEGVDNALRADGLIHRTLLPHGYERNYAYPLVIWLHGPGDDERQLVKIMHHVSLQNYVAIAPRGPIVEPCGYSYTWSQEDHCVSAARQYLHDCLKIARQKFNVNREHIYLAGLQTGGTMALRLALAEPELFAGAISIGGKFPLGCQALLRYKAAQELPLLMLRGLESETYTEADFCDELRLLHVARLSAHCRQYLCGDEVIVPMLKDMNSWMMEHVTGARLLDVEPSNSHFSNGS